MANDAERFDWIRPILRVKAAPPPDADTDLDAAERLLGSPLPAGYRAFARRFGLGGRLHTLPELFRLLPADTPEPHWADSVIDATRFWRSPDAAEDVLPNDFLCQAIIFGIDEGARTFAFHTGEVTGPAAAEYRVYQIPRGCGPEPICESFEDWLHWVHRGYDPATWGGTDEDDDGDDSPPRPPSHTMPYERF
ncbi:SMI1/KNR4 family protein [Gemmata sp. JC673]|uniref:SMI1/KNR4 family protein n=1 Tax=Gemmata algarum TaxID=2975278 RepID=A0ABU5EV53_9BACT|nr:SMI1/KNR4 family protein [Gemmata algarum]MDY3558522.1 SMI1/KNR4 family protein [Gemmata algarum]